jgi:hypothetical protein
VCCVIRVAVMSCKAARSIGVQLAGVVSCSYSDRIEEELFVMIE